MRSGGTRQQRCDYGMVNTITDLGIGLQIYFADNEKISNFAEQDNNVNYDVKT